MSVYQFDPLRDPRWPGLLLVHPLASVFHTPGWLQALHRTYRYEPVVLTTSAPGGELSNGIVFCRVHSRLTGRRLVSLPFSDHCEPLVRNPGDCAEILASLADSPAADRPRYVELRPRSASFDTQPGFAAAREFVFHTLDLAPAADELFRRFHKDCIQRKIRRAVREGVTVETGPAAPLVEEFYRLLVITRRRLGVPPQPRAWFDSLAENLAGSVNIYLARRNGRAVAGILTLTFKDTVVYKYGCSEVDQNRFGGVPLLLWHAIRQAQREGAREMDFGRSDLGDSGLVAFKQRWGCDASRLRYWRLPASAAAEGSPEWAGRVAKPVLACIPRPLLPAVGRAVMRHLG
ncbi:MAG: GNAT family N-acetyltransferase [Bryobacterales bacterium]|nr:GNAT family N-acetyltransferase [Bryobacterales bacterium]